LDKEQLAEDLKSAVPGLCLRIDEPMCNHTSFRIGGPADIMVWPTSIGEVQQVLRFIRGRRVPVYVMGNGSNLLVRDGGYRGVIIKLAENFSQITVEGTKLRAQVGASLAKLAGRACLAGLGGLEFASGIPGTLGGAIAMNAGAYGGEMADVLREVTCCDFDGNLYRFSRDELELGYRTSRVRREGYIALEALLELIPEKPTVIRAKMKELNRRRREKQPLHLPSAGSTFKRPPGHYAGKLIDDAGLRGYTHGRAQVSEQHCGFVVNLGGATAKEVLELIEIVRQRVWEKFRVGLELEVQVIGED